MAETKLNSPGVILRQAVGDVEWVNANPDMLRIIEKMIDEHATILELHSHLIKAFAAPMRMNTPEADKLWWRQ